MPPRKKSDYSYGTTVHRDNRQNGMLAREISHRGAFAEIYSRRFDRVYGCTLNSLP